MIKKIFWIISMLLIPTVCWAVTRIIDLSQITPTNDDITYCADGGATDRKCQVGDISKLSGWSRSSTYSLLNTPTDYIGIGTSTPQAYVHIYNTDPIDLFRIDDQGSDTTPVIVSQDGHVGIGTTAPSGALDVRGAEVRIWTGAGTDTNAGNPGELYVEGDLEVDGTIYGVAATYTGDVTVPTEVYDASGWDGDLTVPTKDAVRDKIETLGAVTSGFVDDGTIIRLNTSTDTVGLGTTTSTPRLTLVGLGTTSATNSMVITDSALSEKLRFDDSGQMGIGTTVPRGKLDVAGTAYFGTSGAGTVSGGANLAISGDGGTTTHMTVKSTGLVGIGSTNPIEKLDVAGTIISSGASNGVNFGDGTVYVYSTAAANGNLTFGSGDNDRMTVNTIGDVGIGSTNPTAALEIAIPTGSNYGFLLKGNSGVNGGNADFELDTANGAGQWDLAADQQSSSRFDIYDRVSNKTPFKINVGAASSSFVISAAGEVSMQAVSSDGTGKVVCIKSDGNLGTCGAGTIGTSTCTCN